MVLLSTVCEYYFWPSHFVFRDTVYRMTAKDTISRLHVFPGSAETLVTTGGTTNHPLIAYFLSNISAKNN